jgi:hypothetical protein
MPEYATLKKNPRKLLALTGLTKAEFEEVLPAFREALADRFPEPKREIRQRAPGGGRKPTYPLQVVQGEMFGMSQPTTSQWIDKLLPVLADALDRLGYLPEREGQFVAVTERRSRGELADLTIDGVERRRNRPKDSVKQRVFYSGKKKGHYDKNVIVADTRSCRVGYLSPTMPGSVHDKAIADHAGVLYPVYVTLRSDLGFEGYAPDVRAHLQPEKSSGMSSCGRARSGATASWRDDAFVSNTPLRASSVHGSPRTFVGAPKKAGLIREC